MKNLFTFIFCLTSFFIFSQVNSLDYFMKYNCETNEYDVKIVILDGSASTIPQRAQFNAQISIVVPTGESITLTNNYMPLQNNQHYTGTEPLKWTLGTPKVSPGAQPENDFYGITPTLSPAAMYNDLNPDDVVTLFSFIAGTSGEYDEGVRFFKNGIDPSYADIGMGGADFSNSFTMGGSFQLYNENIEEFCATATIEQTAIEMNVYPNPFEEQVSIDLFDNAKRIQILGSDGKVYYYSENKSEGIVVLNTSNYPQGLYFIKIETESGINMQKVMKF